MSLTEKKISEKLRKLGMPVNIYGFTYTKTALELIAEDETFLNRLATTKGLYATIAEKHGSTKNRVERAIRHAKEIVFARADITELETLGASKEMTNGEFIGALYECLKYEE